MQTEFVAAWVLTLALHASVLLGAAWALDRGALRARPAWRELLWRVALFGGLFTATAQTLMQMPTSARFIVARVQSAIVQLPVASHLSLVTEKEPVSRSAIGADDAANRPRAQAIVPLRVQAAVSAREGAFAWPSLPRFSWTLLLVVAWLAGAALVFARLLVAWLRLERALSRATPLNEASIATAAAALAIHARTLTPRLSVLDELASPIAVRGRCIALPRWALELLDAEQLRAMLAHETAHLARHDPAWKIATAFWCATLWFLPLATLARRRLDEIAELACDAWAARHLGDGRSLAECLAECAQRCTGFDPQLAPAMAHRDSPLLQRIDHLIEGTPMNISISMPRAGIVAVLSLALAVAFLPGFGVVSVSAQPAVAPPPPSPPAPPAPPPSLPAAKEAKDHHVHISSDIDLFGNKHEFTSIETSNNGHSYRVQVNGKIAFTDNDDDVAQLSDGGKASFGETSAGVQRRVEYASHNGKIEQHYFVGDREQPLDADAHQWIAGIIAIVVRETAIDAEARVKRIHAKGGASAVLDEIGRISSGYARGIYIKQLAAIGKLSSSEVTRALGLIDGIDSDYERRNALAALAAAQPFDATQQQMVLDQAMKVESDYERAELLVGMLPTLAGNPDLRTAWVKAASGITSDYEHRRTLSALLDKAQLDDVTLAQIIEGAKSIGSDYERRELLVAAVREIGDADRVAIPYAAAAGDIGSDYERREALLALIQAPKFGAIGAGAVLDAAQKMGSDYECREVLVALANAMPNDAALIARYRSVVRRLSVSERGEAERALDRFAG